MLAPGTPSNSGWITKRGSSVHTRRTACAVHAQADRVDTGTGVVHERRDMHERAWDTRCGVAAVLCPPSWYHLVPLSLTDVASGPYDVHVHGWMGWWMVHAYRHIMDKSMPLAVGRGPFMCAVLGKARAASHVAIEHVHVSRSRHGRHAHIYRYPTSRTPLRSRTRLHARDHLSCWQLRNILKPLKP